MKHARARRSLFPRLLLACGLGSLALFLVDATAAALDQFRYFSPSARFIKGFAVFGSLYVAAGIVIGCLFICPAFSLLARRHPQWAEQLTRLGLASGLALLVLAAAGFGLVSHASLAPLEPRLPRPPGSVRQEARGRPNVVLIVADSLRQDVLDHDVSTEIAPNLLELGSRATTTTYGELQSVTSWTRPSVASLITGRFPSDLGVHDGHLAASALTVAERLREAGYETAGFSANPLTGPDEGFDQGHEYYWTKHHNTVGRALRSISSRYIPDPVRSRLLRLQRWMAARLRTGHVEAPRVNAQVESWLERRTAEGPFYLYVHYVDTHYPFVIYPEFPENWSNRSTAATYVPHYQIPFFSAKERAQGFGPFGSLSIDDASLEDFWNRYYGSVQYWDHYLGELLRFIESRVEWDNTLVIVTSDHGEEFFEHRWFAHGAALYSESTRVPLVVKWPERLASAIPRHYAQPVSSLQIAPTILEVAGVRDEHAPLFPPLTSTDRAPVVLTEYDRWGMTIVSARLGRHKAIETRTEDGRYKMELFDLEADPAEQRNLWSGSKGELPALFEELDIFGKTLETWRGDASGAPLDEAGLERLRALGYIE